SMTSWKEFAKLSPPGIGFGLSAELKCRPKAAHRAYCRRQMHPWVGTTSLIAIRGCNSSARLFAHIANTARPCRSGRVDRSITLRTSRLSSLTDGNDHIGFQNHEGT